MTLGKARNTIKMREAFPFLSFFFFCLWQLAVQKATLGFLYVPASALNRALIEHP